LGRIGDGRVLTRRFPRANRAGKQLFGATAVPGHITIQKSWRSSMTPGTDHGYLPGRAVAERVQPDLIFDRVDQFTKLRSQRRRLPSGAQVALEHAQLDPGTVAGQQRGDILPAAVAGDVVGHHVPDHDRRARDERMLTSIAPASRGHRDPRWRRRAPWPGGSGQPCRTRAPPMVHA